MSSKTNDEDEAIKEFLTAIGLFVRWLFNSILDFPLVWLAIINGAVCVWFYNKSDLVSAVLVALATGVGVVFMRKPMRNEYLRRKARRRTIRVMRKSFYKSEDGVDASRFIKVKRTPMKDVFRLNLKTPIGRSDKDVMGLMPDIEASLRLQKVIEIDDDPRAGVVSVMVCFVSPLDTDLDGSQAEVLNLSSVDRSNPYHWLSVGVDATGEPFQLPLFLEEGGSVRQLTSGMSGAGKSSIVRQQLLQATLNPFIDVVIVDGKGSEFADFETHVQKYATTKAEFFDVLRLLETEVKRRGELLRQNKLSQHGRLSNSWNNTDDGNFLLWVWDELGVILAGLTTKEAIEVQSRLYGVLSVARSLGIATILSSQTFRADLLDTKTRDNCFDVVIGFRSNSPQESQYLGFTLDDDIRPDKIKGKYLRTGRTDSVGQFATKGIRNTYGKSFFITDDQIRAKLQDF